ncbi:hypothetical protein PJW08_00195 (plasmid) [Tenacibaculum finnmarkense]|nr:hypothetical protein [Tenacibaculum finnmarkense genomovar ulcerans]MCG8857533.1 hypothetical protein [Tenacibaculum finnmarkense]WCC43720.1 hypothetical protein PJW08_00195 [Tenacibaculum finnmarkense]
MELYFNTSILLNNVPWKIIGSVLALLLFYFIVFYNDTSLLNSAEKEKLTQLKQKTGGRFSGQTINAVIGIVYVLISLLIYFIFYKK